MEVLKEEAVNAFKLLDYRFPSYKKLTERLYNILVQRQKLDIIIQNFIFT